MRGGDHPVISLAASADEVSAVNMLWAIAMLYGFANVRKALEELAKEKTN